MKKKLIFVVATGLFAVATVFNMNLLQADSAGDVLLEDISVMAQAQNEGGHHTATYSCIDVLDYSPIRTYEFFGPYQYFGRICSASLCGYNYYKIKLPNSGSCTVYYN